MSVTEKVASADARPSDQLDLRAGLVLIACCACWGINQPAEARLPGRKMDT